MINFPIPTEHCLIVKALHEAGSLRAAAVLLDMDPAHLTRKIQSIPEEPNLIQKVGNKWILSDLGKRVALWVDEGILSQTTLLEEKPMLRIACYTWLAEQMLIPGYKTLNEITQNRYSWGFNVVASNLEQEILSGRSEYVITCHAPNDPLIAHRKFSPDPWMIVVPASWKKELGKMKDDQLIEYLRTKPFIRLASTDAEHTLGFAAGKSSELQINGVIGVRAAVISGLGWSCLPSYSMIEPLRNKQLIQLDLKSATQGELSVWWLRSRKDASDRVKHMAKWVTQMVDSQ